MSPHNRRMLAGALMAAVSAVAFATLAILGKLAYASGMTVAQLLALRFLLAAAGMLGLSAVIGNGFSGLDGRRIVILLLLGAGCYGLQSAMFFYALVYLPASLVELLLYASPALIVVAGWMLFGRPLGPRLIGIVIVNLIGVAMLIGHLEFAGGLPLLLALAVPVANTVYFLTAETVTRGVRALPASSIVIAGAALFWLVVALARGELTLPPSAEAWLILGAFVVGPSMIAIPLMLAALSRIGSARTALISTIEPIVTVALAVSLLAETLTLVQAVGACLILVTVSVIQWRGDSSVADAHGPVTPYLKREGAA